MCVHEFKHIFKFNLVLENCLQYYSLIQIKPDSRVTSVSHSESVNDGSHVDCHDFSKNILDYT